MFVVLKKRLINELRASGAKSAALGLLLLVGMYFWVPPLWRAMGFGTSAASSSSSTNIPTAVETTSVDEEERSGTALTWDHADEILEVDPLLQSAEVAEVGNDPFRIDFSQFPPPVLFAAEPPLPKKVAEVPIEADPAPPELVLKSTIIGRTRRAAFINGKLYDEGTDIRVGDETFRIEAIHPRRVLLSRNGTALELKIPGPPGFTNEVAPRKDSAGASRRRSTSAAKSVREDGAR